MTSQEQQDVATEIEEDAPSNIAVDAAASLPSQCETTNGNSDPQGGKMDDKPRFAFCVILYYINRLQKVMFSLFSTIFPSTIFP